MTTSPRRLSKHEQRLARHLLHSRTEAVVGAGSRTSRLVLDICAILSGCFNHLWRRG